ncbi:hypothetical protein N7492_005282 [Penicillium capsulatum]|uniref:Uncharacterized protein n=1 Tax=Penicillium capsulatum TaxID=69766 RepID=A0A9W9LQU6_9EURO|nr:hypothetical protein N7492_005282 [Penicillium capsulatum]
MEYSLSLGNVDFDFTQDPALITGYWMQLEHSDELVHISFCPEFDNIPSALDLDDQQLVAECIYHTLQQALDRNWTPSEADISTILDRLEKLCPDLTQASRERHKQFEEPDPTEDNSDLEDLDHLDIYTRHRHMPTKA